MNPQHTIPNVIAGELTPTEMGKEQAPNLNVRENNETHRTVDEIIAMIQRWKNRTLHSLKMVEKTQTLCMNMRMNTTLD